MEKYDQAIAFIEIIIDRYSLSIYFIFHFDWDFYSMVVNYFFYLCLSTNTSKIEKEENKMIAIIACRVLYWDVEMTRIILWNFTQRRKTVETKTVPINKRIEFFSLSIYTMIWCKLTNKNLMLVFQINFVYSFIPTNSIMFNKHLDVTIMGYLFVYHWHNPLRERERNPHSKVKSNIQSHLSRYVHFHLKKKIFPFLWKERLNRTKYVNVCILN